MTVDPFSAFHLNGRVALVTGASSGLGERFARVLAAAGASVALVGRRAGRLEELAGSLERSAFVVADVSRPEDVGRAVAETIDTLGKIDVLVNNAGIADTVRAEEAALDQFVETVNVNLIGAYHMAQLVGRHMVSAGQIPQPGYAASKAGLVNLSRELAAQWSRRGVRVNALCPGWVGDRDDR